MKSQQSKQQKKDTKKGGHGAYEWGDTMINCCTGCLHDCIYCYAKHMAISRFKRVEPGQWMHEQIRENDVSKKHKKYDGQVMFPSSHDITSSNLQACMTVLDNLLKAGNRVLIVSKPHLDCIKQICDEFESFKNQILFRFTIGAMDDQILSFWEPNAPSYDERKASLQHAFNEGFATSVSVEPMLDSANIDALIRHLSPYVAHSIWIGTINHLGRLEKHADVVLRQAIEMVRQGQTDAMIKAIYQRHKDNPMIRWKKEIKKIVGIPIPQKNGLDI
jgi:DNA repair photolyase